MPCEDGGAKSRRRKHTPTRHAALAALPIPHGTQCMVTSKAYFFDSFQPSPSPVVGSSSRPSIALLASSNPASCK